MLLPADHPKVAQYFSHKDGQLDTLIAFDSQNKNMLVAVTPASGDIDPDISLFARTALKECKLTLRAQDYGGDLVTIPSELTSRLKASRYYLRVMCRSSKCSFHVSITAEHSTDETEEIKIGETKSGIAYRGVPLHFVFNCTEECAKAAVEESNRRLTFSVWPRDATSVHQLRLLVRKDAEPTTAEDEHLKAARGWFSGEVVGTSPAAGIFRIVVIKRHGHNPIPFVFQVTLPNTVQQIPLGKPFFGAVGRDQMAFYKFWVEEPNTNVQVYLTKLDGDPDMFVSNGAVHPNPSAKDSQWSSRKAGDDEIVIPPDDAKRHDHPTGWFHVGVHGYKHTTFSVIALAETHLTSQDLANRRGEVIDWTELWLGLPQTLSAWPGHSGNFLFYSQMTTKQLFVQVQLLEGPRPDACMASCGSDPHLCAYISPYASPATVASHNYGVVSRCEAGRFRGTTGDSEVTVVKPCSSCWYALLVTSETVVNKTEPHSKFRVLLGAEGRAHPLVAGESFRGHVDANDTAVLLVFDITADDIKNRTQENSTLRFVMTTLYGDPLFSVYGGPESVRSANGTGEDGPLLFDSKATGRDSFSLQFNNASAKEAYTYHIPVWAATRHARFRMQVFWELSPQALEKVTARDFTGTGFPILRNGRPQDGKVQAGKPWFFVYEPTLEGANTTRPTIRVTVTATGQSDLRIWVRPVSVENKTTLESTVLASWQTVKNDGEVPEGWVSKKGSNVLVIPGWDGQYLAPGDGCYLVAVWSYDNTTNASFELEVSTAGAIEELPISGTSRPGTVAAGEYARYRIEVPDIGMSMSVVARATSGDVDLYVGPNATVGRGSSLVNSTLYGSDSVFIPAFDETLAKYCTAEVIAAQGDCVWYAAVLGVSKVSHYEISSVVHDGRPTKLAPNSDSLVLLPPGGLIYFYMPLHDPTPPMTLQVNPQAGSLRNISLKVVSRARAKHPSGELARLSTEQADMNASYFAGTWGMRIEPKDMRKWCQRPEVTADGSGCAALFVFASSDGYWGRLILLTSTSQPEVKANSTAPPEPAKLAMLEAGTPARGSLRSTKEQLVYGFMVSDATGDLEVSLTPLTQCWPVLQVQFPSDGDDGQAEMLEPRSDPQLHYISVRIPHTDPKFRPGLYRFWAKQNTPANCEFDLRVQVGVQAGGSDSDSVADFSDGGMATPLMLQLNVPVYTSSNSVRYFLFTSQLGKSWHAADPATRKNLEVTFTVLEGGLKVEAATLTNAKSDSSMTKKERLAAAIADLKSVKSESDWGAPQLFTIRDLDEMCGKAVDCQLLIRVNSDESGRYADYTAVASEQGSSTRPEVLLLGVPITGCVGSKCARGNVSTYQLYVTNPSARVLLHLTCQVEGSGDFENCKHLRLSADALPEFRRREERAYLSKDGGEVAQELELMPRKNGKARKNEGLCAAPCVLLIYVEVTAETTDSPTTFSLSANTAGGYTLLIDGDEPVMRTVRSSRPEYFLFDSRRASPLLTLLVTLPKEHSNPSGEERVVVYTLDCTNSTDSEDEEDALPMPSAEHKNYTSFVNSRGQIVTFIRRGPTDVSLIREGRHCYYRVAVVSKRSQPVTVAIRGFDWHPASPLLLDEPLEGMVDKSHSYNYTLQGSTTSGHVVLSLEVCSGAVRLMTRSDRAGHLLRAEGGLLPTELSVEEHQGVELHSAHGRLSTYILTAEDPSKRTWLEPRPGSDLTLAEESGGIRLTWSPSRLFGAGQPAAGAETLVTYEVFCCEQASVSKANRSTACGLYREWVNGATRLEAQEQRTLMVNSLHPGVSYVINVVAKSETGHVVAYSPFYYAGSVMRLPPASGRTTRMYWGQAAPLVVMGISVAFFIFARPCCKGHYNSTWRRFELELPAWERRARHIDAYRYGSSGVGNYAPPAVVGVAGTPYSQI